MDGNSVELVTNTVTKDSKKKKTSDKAFTCPLKIFGLKKEK